MIEFFKFISVVAVLVAAFVASILTGAYYLDAYECGNYEQATGVPTKMTGFSCYIFDDGRWYTAEQYKFRQAK